jgi:beta-glucosidase
MTSATTGNRGDESALIGRLTLEQKVRLLTGADSWHMNGESAVGLRPIVMSDGPAGVRGTRFDSRSPSSSLPCPIALGATWDEQLVNDLAFGLGQETRGKGVDVLLAPTINIVRTPLSGRGFECFSEDPLLTTRIAVAYVRGVQKAGVGATAKHYVANDSETERRTYDARISDTVLRELYLVPFEACVAEANVALIMAAYNSVNGAAMTANPVLLRDLLKGEWEFDGVVVSDWSATKTTVPSAIGGLDLVMPGPHGPWGDHLIEAVRAGRVREADIDDKVARILVLARRLGALNGKAEGDAGRLIATHAAPAMVDPELVRQATARSFVLLTNPRNLLPMRSGSVQKLALIGPNAVDPQTQGGGSVRVLPVAGKGIAEAIGDAMDAFVSVSQGCVTTALTAAPKDGSLFDPESGEAGVRLEVRAADGTVVYDARFPSSAVTWWDGLPDAVHLPGSEVVMRARYRAGVSGLHMLGAAGVGVLRVLLDGSLLAEATTLTPRDAVEALSKPPEVRIPVQLRAGQEVEITLEHRPNARGNQGGFANMRLGIAPELDAEALLEEAVKAARAADVAVVVVGSADGAESEGYDRDSLSLSGRQDELVRRVASANTNTVVVVNSGMPVLMSWAEDVAAVIQVWFPGQAFGESLADVLTGAQEPGGRLPISVPRAEADSPVLSAYPVAGELNYTEGLLVGYRGYDRTGSEPHFSFGHGLGYTEWTYESMATETGSVAPGRDLPLVVRVRNTGERTGREVVQVYLEGPDDDPRRPLRILAAFANVIVGAGEQAEARLTVQARSFGRFDEGRREWVWKPGTYTLRAGRSSRDLRLSSEVVMR